MIFFYLHSWYLYFYRHFIHFIVNDAQSSNFRLFIHERIFNHLCAYLRYNNIPELFTFWTRDGNIAISRYIPDPGQKRKQLWNAILLLECIRNDNSHYYENTHKYIPFLKIIFRNHNINLKWLDKIFVGTKDDEERRVNQLNFLTNLTLIKTV